MESGKVEVEKAEDTSPETSLDSPEEQTFFCDT